MARFNNFIRLNEKQRKIIDDALFDYFLKTLNNPKNHQDYKKLDKKIEEIKATQRKFMLPRSRRVNKKNGFGMR